MPDPNKKPVALVLGGTSPHAELLRLLKNRGFWTILIDFYENPPAKHAADDHLQESTLDKTKVLEIARKCNAALVISTCIDQANVTACYALENLGKFSPYDYKTAVSVSNKIEMKSKMITGGIPTSKFIQVSEIDAADWSMLKFPLIVKPSDSNSSKGVRRCDTNEMVSRYLKEAIALSRTNQAVVEEFKEGREIAFDSYLLNGKVHILITRERRKIIGFGDQIQQIYGSFWPANLSDEIEAKLIAVGEKIGTVFGLDNTPLMVQTIVHNNEVNVIEFAPRIGGGENYRIIQMATGFNLIDAAIDSFLDVKPVLNFHKTNRIFLDKYLYVSPSQFGKIQGLQELLEQKMIECYDVYKSFGAVVTKEISSNNRVGSFIVSADKQETGIDKIQNVMGKIEVFDIKGDPILIKSI
ncbi:ATP-grasp domain-containing protein [Desulfobacter latus]|uniref:ATP-grasp domain-containing protein n=1 Tax=Desulfobacter latus TaxID=2292 RepID=A0A850TB17_9BACT|nr:ATP-grasp domain-containing protein [Desulfobacter latus]NWH05798.1 ATP-grasp domain-containing protein [Desulfobacter latus]